MRNLSPQMQAAITARVVVPAVLVDLTFKTETVHIWTGIGSIDANGFTYQGVGSLGSIGNISEGTTVESAGTTLTLSGVDPALYADTIADITTGLPASIWLACLAGNTVIDTILMFSGQIDQPTINEGGDSIEINLALESRLTNLQRANRRLWTDAEQRRDWPNDSGFMFVTPLQDESNVWG